MYLPISTNEFLNIYLQKSYIDCRRKLHSRKSERFESIDEKSPFVYASVF